MKCIPLRAVRILPLIASPIDGEALAACRTLERILVASGLDLHDMAAAIVTAPEHPPHWAPVANSHFDLARAARDLDGGRLTYRERQFVEQMCRLGNGLPTPRQANWLADLHTKLSTRAAA